MAEKEPLQAAEEGRSLKKASPKKHAKGGTNDNANGTKSGSNGKKKRPRAKPGANNNGPNVDKKRKAVKKTGKPRQHSATQRWLAVVQEEIGSANVHQKDEEDRQSETTNTTGNTKSSRRSSQPMPPPPVQEIEPNLSQKRVSAIPDPAPFREIIPKSADRRVSEIYDPDVYPPPHSFQATQNRELINAKRMELGLPEIPAPRAQPDVIQEEEEEVSSLESSSESSQGEEEDQDDRGKETKVHEETTVDDGLNLMDEIAEQNAVEEQIADIIAGVVGTTADQEEAVEAELEALDKEAAENDEREEDAEEVRPSETANNDNKKPPQPGRAPPQRAVTNPGDPRGANPAPPPFWEIIPDLDHQRRVSEIFDPDELPPPNSFQANINLELINTQRMAVGLPLVSEHPKTKIEMINLNRELINAHRMAAGLPPIPAPNQQPNINQEEEEEESSEEEEEEESDDEESEDDTILRQIAEAKKKAQKNPYNITSYGANKNKKYDAQRPPPDSLGGNNGMGFVGGEYEKPTFVDPLAQPGDAALDPTPDESKKKSSNNKSQQSKACALKWLQVLLWVFGIAYTVNLLAFAVAYFSAPRLDCDQPLRYICELLMASWCLDIMAELLIAAKQHDIMMNSKWTREVFRVLTEHERTSTWTWVLYGLITLGCKATSFCLKVVLLVLGIPVLVYETCAQSELYRYVQQSIVLGSIFYAYQFTLDWDRTRAKKATKRVKKKGTKLQG